MFPNVEPMSFMIGIFAGVWCASLIVMMDFVVLPVWSYLVYRVIERYDHFRTKKNLARRQALWLAFQMDPRREARLIINRIAWILYSSGKTLAALVETK